VRSGSGRHRRVCAAVALAGVLVPAIAAGREVRSGILTRSDVVAHGGPPAPVASLSIGTTVEGRTIRGWQVGDASSRRRVLVVGCVHGDELAGEAITRRLRATAPPGGTSLLVVNSFNPDGRAAGTRQNAHGVDLNRNAPWHWRHLDRPGGTYYSGPRPLSEPESRALVRLVRRFRPAISIWYHQHARLVVASGGDPAIERRYARLVGLRFGRLGPYPGSITSWQNAAFRRDTAFVVELPAGRLPSRSTTRHVNAILRLAARR
jgi:murein peptide amidase A